VYHYITKSNKNAITGSDIMEKIIKKIIRVVLYIRVSTEEQAKYGYSLKAQLRMNTIIYRRK